jgi:opacity protein-like surface antigen
MNKILALAAAALLSTTAIASAQVTSPTPGQPGAQVAPGTPNSSDNDPNNPAASRDAEKNRMGTTGSGSMGSSGSQNDLTGPATKPAEKAPQQNDPTPDRQKNVQ